MDGKVTVIQRFHTKTQRNKDHKEREERKLCDLCVKSSGSLAYMREKRVYLLN